MPLIGILHRLLSVSDDLLPRQCDTTIQAIMAKLASSRGMSIEFCGRRPRAAVPSIGHSCSGTSRRRRLPARRPPPAWASSRLLLIDLLVVVAARFADRDLPRLHRLRNLAYQLDLQQAVLDVRTLHLHMIGEAEGALEGAGGDALIQHRLRVLHGLAALDG